MGTQRFQRPQRSGAHRMQAGYPACPSAPGGTGQAGARLAPERRDAPPRLAPPDFPADAQRRRMA